MKAVELLVERVRDGSFQNKYKDVKPHKVQQKKKLKNNTNKDKNVYKRCASLK